MVGNMLDAVNPDRIPAALDGQPALRYTVLADPAGEAFDVETGNAPLTAVVIAMSSKVLAGEWCVGYTNHAGIDAMTTAMATVGLVWSNAVRWPAPGVYLGAADWTGTQHLQPAWTHVQPLYCQWRNGPDVDYNVTAPGFPAAVAGYIDGPISKWPERAWQRFTRITAPPDPPPAPAPTKEGHDMQGIIDGQGSLVIVGVAADNGNLLVFTRQAGGGWSVTDVTDWIKTHSGDPRFYRVV